MPISSTDPAFLLIYGLDEALATAIRANSGSLGTAQQLTPGQTTGSDGIPAVSDGQGGNAAYFDVTYPSPFNTMTASARYMRAPTALGSAHTCKPALPIASAADDFAFGGRFKWVAGETDGGGATEGQAIIGLFSAALPSVLWSLCILPAGSANPQTNGRIRLNFCNTNFDVTGGSWTATGTPPSQYILPDVWYRIIVRVYFSATGYRIKLYIYEESTGTTYTFDYNAAALTTDYSAPQLAATDVRVTVGCDLTNPHSLYGYIDQCWLYDAAMSDGDASSLLTSGFTVPYSPTNYTVLSHDVRFSAAKEGASFPIPRALPVGGKVARHDVQVNCQRFRSKWNGFRPGRPWSLRKASIEWDSIGPYVGRQNNKFAYPPFDKGVVRLPGELPAGALADVRDMEFSGPAGRRRRGYIVRRINDTTADLGANSFHFFRDINNGLHGVYKVGDKLFEERGADSGQLDTGWNAQQMAVYGELFGRVAIITRQRRKTWRGTAATVESFGLTVGAVPTLALVAGTLTGTYYYAYTEFDPTTLDESAPAISASITPAAQGVTVTMPAVNSDTRFSKRRIYRTTAGGSAPFLFLIAEITSATTYTDGPVSAADGTVRVGSVVNTSNTLLGYTTLTPPDTFGAVTIHRERAFYYNGETYPNRVYWTEAGKLMTFYPAGGYIDCEANIRCIVAQGQRLIVLTDRTVEILESDWSRDADGNYTIQRTVVSRNVGGVGPHCAINISDTIFWMDGRSIWTLLGDKPVRVASEIDNLVPEVNHSLASRIVASFNHIRRQLWFCVAMGNTDFQTDSTRFQTVIVLQLAPDSSPLSKWSFYRLEASYARSFDDDLNGLQFGVIDHMGTFKQMETYEGDGIDTTEAYTYEGTISTLVAGVLTPTAAPGWTAAALRGMSVLLYDVATGNRFVHLIQTNATGTLTLIGTVDASIGVNDLFYIGGIDAWVEPSEQGFDSHNNKAVRRIKHEFDDLTLGRNL